MKTFFLWVGLLAATISAAFAADALTENFTGTDGTLITSHTADSGATWVLNNGTNGFHIQTNRARFNPGASSFAIYNSSATSGSANTDMQGTFYCSSNAGGDEIEMWSRYRVVSGNGVFYSVVVRPAGAITLLYRPSGTGGADVTLGSVGYSFVIGQSYVIRFTCTDSVKKVYVNGVKVISSNDNTLAGTTGDTPSLLAYNGTSADLGMEIDALTLGPVNAPGVTSASATGTTTVTASTTAATGDTGTYTAQFQRAPDVSGSPGTFANAGSAQAAIALGTAPTSLSDTGLTAGTTYWYRVQITYSLNSIVLYTDPVSVTTTTAGLNGGVTSASATGSTTATVNNTAASVGTAPYNYQFQRAPNVSGSPGTFANVGTPRTAVANTVAPTALSDTGLSASTIYWYRCVVTDSAAGSVNTTAVSITTPSRSPGTFYLSAAGNDSTGDGSIGTPWLTLGKINTLGVVPGDTILLRGGDTFTGNLNIQPSSQPTAALPIVVSSYGTGLATISSPTTQSVSIIDCGFVTVKNLNLTGPGLTSAGSFPSRTVSCSNANTALFIQTSAAATYRYGIVVDNLTITGFQQGMSVATTATTPTQGFSDMVISNVTVHDCCEGIWVIADYSFVTTTSTNNRRIRITGCTVYNIPGVTTQVRGTGFPIFINNGMDSSIENCLVHDAGDAQNAGATNGVAGLMFINSTNCAMRFCESYNMRTPQTSNGDGDAFDFDAHCTNCLIEYCYGHDCDGAVMLLWNENGGTGGSSTGAIVRYNVFVNGGRRAQSTIGTLFSATPFTGTSYIYNNVFYQDGAASSMTNELLVRSSTCNFVNNIFSVGGAGGTAVTFGNVATSTCVGNTYNVRTGSTFSLVVNSTTYTSLAALHTATYETLNGVPVGASGDPVFTTPGSTSAQLPGTALTRFSAYDIGAGSVSIGTGVDPLAILASAGVPIDWHGNLPVRATAAALFDAGIARFGSTAPTSGTGGAHAFSF